MKKILLVFICLIAMSGCASLSKDKKEIIKLNETLALKNIEIENLQDSIKEKDSRIEKLKAKLKTFGAFE